VLHREVPFLFNAVRPAFISTSRVLKPSFGAFAPEGAELLGLAREALVHLHPRSRMIVVWLTPSIVAVAR